MTDQTEEQTTTIAAGEDSGSNVQQMMQEVDETTKKLDKMTTSFSIWPPTQRTRDAVIKRLLQTLSEKSVLSDRYGTIPADEAAGVARRIEEEAFNAASNIPVSAEDDGIEILQYYSKEISKRMLDTVKSRSASSATSSTLDEKDGATADAAAQDEESSTVETQS
ncbi:hypothetical protein L6452_39064 [Arctium lappa]|uniref:Uncharacterized protein n=1 Tax=Arctium lappa TaxID=4217 RepID=A0ACB8XRH8_ARCLA|nr:hypothetical protein L6452_39064 [Arctium lappa]